MEQLLAEERKRFGFLTEEEQKRYNLTDVRTIEGIKRIQKKSTGHKVSK